MGKLIALPKCRRSLEITHSGGYTRDDEQSAGSDVKALYRFYSRKCAVRGRKRRGDEVRAGREGGGWVEEEG